MSRELIVNIEVRQPTVNLCLTTTLCLMALYRPCPLNLEIGCWGSNLEDILMQIMCLIPCMLSPLLLREVVLTAGPWVRQRVIETS
jgi:hypothetical protein